MQLNGIDKVMGLSSIDQDRLNKCVRVLKQHSQNNAKRSKYYDERITAADVNIGIAVPENMRTARDITCPWAKKAVSTLANRSVFDGFVNTDDELVPNEMLDLLNHLVSENDLTNRYRKFLRSELVHGVSFATVSRGLHNEPAAVVNIHSADKASAVWDNRLNRIEYGMAISKTGQLGGNGLDVPLIVDLYTDEATIQIMRFDLSTWHATYMPHAAGRPLMEPLSYMPDELHPFGQSRISEPVMSIIDGYLRARLRMEIGAELFTSPQKVISGADDDAFEMDKMESYITKILLLGKDEDGDVPHVSLLQASSMQPHIDVMRNLAAQFAGATNTPISELGVIHDNPSSAQAMFAAAEPLIIEAIGLNADNGVALRNIAILMLAIALNERAEILLPLRYSIQPKFKNPSMPSMVANADSAVKICASCPSFAGTPTYWEMLGFNAADIERIQSDIAKQESKAAINALVDSLTEPGDE